MSTAKIRYVPATTRAHLMPGSKHRAFDAFMMSEQLARPTRAVARTIAFAASGIAFNEARDTGAYSSAFRVEEAMPIFAGSPAFPRRTFRVVNDDDSAAANEYGNERLDADGDPVIYPARRILARAGFPFHTPRGIA